MIILLSSAGLAEFKDREGPGSRKQGTTRPRVASASDTRDGIITLTGHVRTWAEHDAVVGAALMARGVIDIRDELQVTG